MTNNDKLRKIISNLQILNDLMNGMIDAEIYPVSFFSQSFDLLQTVQNDVHALETEQVEMFATQMKKHRELIISIHKQMRNISITDGADVADAAKTTDKATVSADREKQQIIHEDPESNKEVVSQPPALEQDIVIPTTPPSPPPTPTPTSSPSLKSEPAKKTTVSKTHSTSHSRVSEKRESSSEKQKKSSLLGILGISTKDEHTHKSSRHGHTSRSDKPSYADRSSEQNKVTSESEHSAPTGKIAIPQQQPVVIEQQPVQPEPDSSKPTLIMETRPPVSEVAEKNKLDDLRKSFSINDRFRYRRELFDSNEERMYRAIANLNTKTTLKDAMQFIEDNLHWDLTSSAARDFVKVLEKRFL